MRRRTPHAWPVRIARDRALVSWPSERQRAKSRDAGAPRHVGPNRDALLLRWIPGLASLARDTRAAQRGTVSARTLAASALRSSAQIAAISGPTS
jgi:hypothetical protein